MTTAEQLEICQKRCEEIRSNIKSLRSKSGTTILKEMGGNVEVEKYTPQCRNLCTGHFGKIYALHWGHDSQHIVTASQDGKLIVWTSNTGNKQLAITLNSAWVMTCAFSPSYDFIASGGLDNTVSIFRTNAKEQSAEKGGLFKTKELHRELEKHDGYLSSARFLSDGEIISASGDGTCILWDIESRSCTKLFQDHSGDVMSIALNKKQQDLFVSGSVDATAKVWDLRSKNNKCVANFPGHEADINAVQWFPDMQGIITGSDDGTVRMFDIRCYRQLNEYSDPTNKSLHSQDLAGCVSVAASSSGCYIFAAYDNGQVNNFNSLNASKLCDLRHDQRVSSLAISPNGYGLATGCWDFNLRIFA